MGWVPLFLEALTSDASWERSEGFLFFLSSPYCAKYSVYRDELQILNFLEAEADECLADNYLCWLNKAING